MAVTAISGGKHRERPGEAACQKLPGKKTYTRSGNEALPTLFLYPAPSFAFLIRGVGGVTLTCLWASSLPLGTEIAVSLMPGKFLEMLCEEWAEGLPTSGGPARRAERGTRSHPGRAPTSDSATCCPTLLLFSWSRGGVVVKQMATEYQRHKPNILDFF